MEAWATGLRALEPLKITSAMDSPRRCLAEDSPITQRTASMMFDLPHPLGPTTAVRFSGNEAGVGSTKDLNPASLIVFSLIVLAWRPRPLLTQSARDPAGHRRTVQTR